MHDNSRVIFFLNGVIALLQFQLLYCEALEYTKQKLTPSFCFKYEETLGPTSSNNICI